MVNDVKRFSFQSDLQEFKAFQGLETTYACAVVNMLNVMLTCPLPGRHTCLDLTSPADVVLNQRPSRIRAKHLNEERDKDNPDVYSCELCDEQAVLFDLVYSLMQQLCPPMETKLSQLYVMEPEHFTAAIASMAQEAAAAADNSDDDSDLQESWTDADASEMNTNTGPPPPPTPEVKVVSNPAFLLNVDELNV